MAHTQHPLSLSVDQTKTDELESAWNEADGDDDDEDDDDDNDNDIDDDDDQHVLNQQYFRSPEFFYDEQEEDKMENENQSQSEDKNEDVVEMK
jgi:hypothetical protein